MIKHIKFVNSILNNILWHFWAIFPNFSFIFTVLKFNLVYCCYCCWKKAKACNYNLIWFIILLNTVCLKLKFIDKFVCTIQWDYEGASIWGLLFLFTSSLTFSLFINLLQSLFLSHFLLFFSKIYLLSSSHSRFTYFLFTFSFLSHFFPFLLVLSLHQSYFLSFSLIFPKCFSNFLNLLTFY